MCIIRTAGPIRQKLLLIPGTNASVLFVRLGAKAQELCQGLCGNTLETCSEAVHRSKLYLGKSSRILVVVATIILVSITSDKNNYSHFIITLFMLFYKQQMLLVGLWSIFS